MKNLSKVLAVVLALVMALSMVSFAAYTDVADDANYAEAVSVLSSLDMLKGYEDGTFKPEGDITRAEFAMVVCRLLGYGATAEVPASYAPFNDVPADHWASGAIALAAQQKIVNGYGDGNFGPEDNVTYEQAIKMVVAALGYTIVAESNGGYPGGFQIVAAQAGILDGITDGKAGLPASRGVVAQLAYNALDVPMMSQVGFGDEVKYDYDNTLLLNRIGVVKVEATIAGTAKSNASLKANEVGLTVGRQYAAVKSNNEAGWYALGTTTIKPDISTAAWVTASKVKADADVIALAESYIDYEVEAYVANPTTRDAKLVAIAMKDAGYSEIAFAAEDIDTNETNLGLGELAIFVDETKEDSEVYDIAISKVYLNGRVNAGLLSSIATFLADTAEADIRLFDNDGDDVYEIAYVTAYVDYVVDSVNVRNYRVIGTAAPTNPVLGTWPQRLILDEENEDYSFEIVKDGEVVDITAIAENDVLSVAGGLQNTNELAYGTVIINTQAVAGTINGLDTDNDIVYIDGVEYPYAAAVEASLNLGDTADFYINARGIICGLDASTKTSSLKYGFVTVAMESTGLTADTMELRMMDTAGTWNTYVLDKDFDLNGATGTVVAFKALGNNDVNAAKYVYNKVVAYELNADGEIDNLYVTPNTVGVPEFISDSNVADKAYNAATEIYNGKTLADSTVIFSVPTYPVSATVAVDEDDVAIATKDVLVDRSNYKMTAFNTDEDGIAPILLGYGITGRIDWADNFMIITGKSTRTNDKGEVGVLLTGMVNGEEVTLFSSTETGGAKVYNTTVSAGAIVENADLGFASVLAKGDVILYSVNGAGEAAKIVRVQDAATIDGYVDGNSFSRAAVKIGTVDVAGTIYTYYLGYVNEVRSSRITIQEDMLAAPADATALTIKADTVVTEIDTNHAAGVKVIAGDMGSFVADAGIAVGTPDNDGDIVLLKAVNDVVVVEAVVYKAD